MKAVACLCLTLAFSGAARAEEIPLVRVFWIPEGQHSYNDTLAGFDEHEKLWRGRWKNLTIICEGYDTPEDGTIRLYRWRQERTHRLFYGSELPLPLAKAGYKLEPFEMYVFPKKQPGTIPVYGCIRPDYTDLFLSGNRDEVVARIQEVWRVEKVQLADLKIVFWAPPPRKEHTDKAAEISDLAKK